MQSDASDPVALNAAIVEGGLPRVPFFNGRVLTAEALQAEQDANAAERRRLGRALGEGVVNGLFVRKKDTTPDEPATTVVVDAGLGLAPSGQMVELPRQTEVSVVSSVKRSDTAGTRGTFEDCASQTVTTTSGSGAYLLVAEPASKPRGRAPRTGISGDGAAGECGADRRVEGARLRLVSLDLGDEALVPSFLLEEDGSDDLQTLADEIEKARADDEVPPPATVSTLRNVLAHVCLRTPSARTATASLYDTLRRQAGGEARSGREGTAESVDNEGPLDVLRRRFRTQDGRIPLDDAVPLGLLYWASDRIEFVDVWSVRRRVHRLDPHRPAPATDRRRAEGEAALYQFQDHVADLPDREPAGDLLDVELETYFRYLPAAGLVPLVNAAGRPGVAQESFLGDYPASDPVYVEGHRVPLLLDRATLTPPVDLKRRTALRVYKVREAEAARSHPDTLAGPPPGTATPYLLLASGYLPRLGDARYDLSHGDYAHFYDPKTR